MHVLLVLLVVIPAAAAAAGSSGSGTVNLVVGFCPTDFTSKGAVVNVDVATGNFSIVGTFDWGKAAIEGCLFDYDPTVWVDVSTQTVYLDFTEDEGYTVTVDLNSATLSSVINPHDPFFTGYENFEVTPDLKALVGLTPTVTEKGYCSDGCFGWGIVDLTSKDKYTQVSTIPFKACMDDSHFLDYDTGIFYVQCSYDLRPPAERCAKDNAAECMVAINITTGDLVASPGPNNFSVEAFSYKTAASPSGAGALLGWVDGFYNTCKNPYNDYAFATIDVTTASATLINCIPHDITVDTAEWIAAFSADNTQFATGSGNDYGTSGQLLVFDTSSGDVLLNTDLAGLPEALNAGVNDLFVIWSVAMV